eukprot:Em0014g266a
MFKTRFLLLYVCFGGIGLFHKECGAQIRQFNVSGQSDVVVSSTGQLFVGANISQTGYLVKLNTTSAQQELLQFPSGTYVLRLSLSSDESRLVACLSNRSCIEYDANNFAKGPVTVFNNILTGGINVSLVSAPAGSVSRTSGNLFSVTASTFTRNWYGGFVAGSYTYFVVQDTSPLSTAGVRVLRVCDNINEISVAAMVETELNCLGLATRVDAASRFAGASLVNAYPSGTSFEPTIVVAAVTPNSINGGSSLSRACTFSLSSIDSAIANVSSRCSSGALPWRSSPSSPSCYSTCNTSSPGAISTPALVQTSALFSVSLSNKSFDLSYIMSFNYESLTLLLIAFTDQINQAGQSTLYAYRVTDGASLGVRFSVLPMPGPVTRLTWTSGQNYVYAITNTSVVQVPIEQCSSFTDCLSCAASVNPLCGWCTVEQKCSRRSQCQNSTVSARWVQGNTSQCLSNTSVTPTTYTLERPTNINLTISSGLPSPLTGESFLCLLSTGNGVPISVPCSLVNQTTFIYNITGAISQLNTPKLVVNIGFGSSLLNIPFATSRLTTYNCAAATSCSSCLQTDGVCGWCNVEKRCTAVNSSCSNFTSVTSAGGQTYLDVCPSLLNGPYLLPVAVNRPLVLNTKNLPPQGVFALKAALELPGYQYNCSLQLSSTSVTLPANYINSTSISCVYTAAQISLPVGTTAMLANISLIWTNSGTVVYPIDPLGVIQVTLYSCSSFSVTSCTSCLAVNIGTGYGCGWCGGTSRCVEPETCPSITNQLLNCPSPVLRSVTPSSGPFGGGTRLTITGTDLGVTVGDISNVTVGGVNCSVQPDGFKPGAQFVCVTGNYPYGGMPQTVPISVTMRSGSVATAQYTYVRPSISSVFPKSGPMAGGTNVTIEGMSLNVGTGVKRVLLNGAMCVILQSSFTQVNCTSSAQNVTGVGVVTVYIDNEVTINNAVTFEHTNNPNYTSVSPDRIIPAGGIILTFTGTYLNVSQKALLVTNGMAGTFPCIQTFTTLKCYAPPLDSNPIGSSLSPGVDYTIVMDGAPGPVGDPLKIAVVSNPIFTSINPNDLIQTVGSVKIIRINGMNIMNVDVLSEIRVTVGGERCTIDLGTTTDTVLSCQPPQNLSTVSSTPSKKRQLSSNGTVIVRVGQSLGYTLGAVNYYASTTQSFPTTTPFPVLGVAVGVGVGGLVFLVVVVVMAIVTVWYRRDSTKKSRQVDNLLIMLETWEANMADECKRAFAELQTELQDVVNVHDKNYPYRDFRSFAMKFLFPTAEDDHPILKPVQRTSNGRFTLQDRCNVASLLIVALQKNLFYATDILQSLLTSHIRASANKGNPRLLLRRTETIAEKFLSTGCASFSTPISRAIKSQLEKGPVDVITGEARNSLSEEKLLRQHLDVNVVEGVVENENEVVPIKLLDTDTISQAKEKILDALYKNTPVSRRPQLGQVDLELRRGSSGVLLRDHDSSNEREGQWLRINTLGHYKLDHMSKSYQENQRNPQPHFRLIPRNERPLSMISLDTLGTMIANISSPSRSSLMIPTEEERTYHLVSVGWWMRPEAADPAVTVESGASRPGTKIMSEVFLTRLLSTKLVPQYFIQATVLVSQYFIQATVLVPQYFIQATVLVSQYFIQATVLVSQYFIQATVLVSQYFIQATVLVPQYFIQATVLVSQYFIQATVLVSQYFIQATVLVSQYFIQATVLVSQYFIQATVLVSQYFIQATVLVSQYFIQATVLVPQYCRVIKSTSLRILQPYVDDVFKVVFSNSSDKPIPKAVKYLFDFLDLQAADMGILDPDVLHTWKTNSLVLRFWVNLLKNPDFVFDIHKSVTVDSCLSVISQAYIDACSTSETKYTKDTPSAKLLYVNEVKQYKDHVRGYYDMIQCAPKLDNREMDAYLRTTVQPTVLFSTEGAVYELFKCAVQYSDEIIAALREKDLTDQALSFQSIAEAL